MDEKTESKKENSSAVRARKVATTIIKKRVVKSKAREEEESYEREVLWHIQKYVNNHHEYCEIQHFPGGLLLGKTVERTVTTENNRSTFQPYSSTEKKKDCVNAIIEYSDYAQRPPNIQALFKSGCRVLEIYSDSQVKETLESI